jgi:hypothetical protein
MTHVVLFGCLRYESPILIASVTRYASLTGGGSRVSVVGPLMPSGPLPLSLWALTGTPFKVIGRAFHC